MPYQERVTFGLIDVPSRRLAIIDAELLPAGFVEQHGGDGLIVVCVTGPIADLSAEVDIESLDDYPTIDIGTDNEHQVIDADVRRLIIDVLRATP